MRPKIGFAVEYNKTGKAPSPMLPEQLFLKKLQGGPYYGT